MKVVAIKNGFIHGLFRRVGAEFECSKEEFSDVWMSEYKSDVPEPIDNSKVKKAEDVKHEPLEIPSLMNKEKKPAKKKAAKKTTKKAD